MCRNIKTLYNYEPPATEEEIRAASLQYVRKISGFARPSAANEEAFARAVDSVARATATLLHTLVTSAAPRDRDAEAVKAHERAVRRFAPEEIAGPGCPAPRGAQ
jgi:hypothetical protein